VQILILSCLLFVNKFAILSHSYVSFSEEIFRRLGKGRRQAGTLYSQLLRKGKLDRTDPVFRNAQELLDEILDLTGLDLPELLDCRQDGNTGKFLLRTPDELEIESVLIPMQSGSTLCVSSQVGCRMGCAFCETGRMGLLRNLSVEEIVSQIYMARVNLGAAVRNIVFMGMGEPFDNYDNVMGAVRILTDPLGFGYGKKHISVSTSGCVDGIERLMDDKGDTPNLAVSINAPTDELRNRLMPINRTHNLQQLHQAMDAYCRKTRRQILIAYILLQGVNDTLEHADQLAAYLRGLDVKINIIPYNPQSRSRFVASEDVVMEEFTKRLREHGYYTLLRATKGQRIMAACGQLGNLKLRQKNQTFRVKNAESV